MSLEPRGRGRPKLHRLADCHPDRPHYCKGQCRSCYQLAYQRAHPAQTWRIQRKSNQTKRFRLLGITRDQLDQMLRKAGGVCPVCLRPGQTLKVWRYGKSYPVLGLVCWMCRCRMFVLVGTAKDRRYGVSWLERVLKLIRKSVGPDQPHSTDTTDLP